MAVEGGLISSSFNFFNFFLVVLERLLEKRRIKSGLQRS